ncbi:MAG: methionine adenosyltransferase [Coleofasciculus sp. C1-SOL-03]|jgi:S-adenosylmethionine synthetase|uniref:methionine adenosyltransferase n=1 Tax=Coleofasciculus sp. C1-SOL-03 TaxID=3069522 RepID=UPI0032F1E197
MKKNFMFTSESVTPGHPDKLCDRISDAIVDRLLQQDPYARVITECAVSTGIVFLAARFEPNANVDFTNIARKVIAEVGYDRPDFNSKTCSILTSLEELPPDKIHNFDEKKLSDAEIEEIPVKNQVTVFGFACNQTPALMPLPIWFAHKLARQLDIARRDKILPYLAPDGKTQVGVEYKNRQPTRIHSLTIIASQNSETKPNLQQLRHDIQEAVIQPALNDEAIHPDENSRIFVNPDGLVIGGGPSLHSGLTGRKNAIDTYGEYSKHSGAALSGKDPIRIDRIGAYAARYAAKNVVAANLADECEVQLSYTIGLSRPVSVEVETFGTGKVDEQEIIARLKDNFDFRLAGIIRHFNLRFLPSLTKGGFYQKLAAYGHVGRMDLELPWEKTDKAEFLKG